MKIAVISDIHGNLKALETALSIAAEKGCEKYIVLGDIAVKGPYPEEVIKSVMDLEAICTIKGNTDRWLIENPININPEMADYVEHCRKRISQESKDYLDGLPEICELEEEGRKLLVFHASHDSDLIGIDMHDENGELEMKTGGKDYDICLFGHTHMQFHIESGSKVLVNPGSVGLPFNGTEMLQFGIIEFGADKIDVELIKAEYNIEEVITEAIRTDLPHVEKYAFTLRNGRLEE